MSARSWNALAAWMVTLAAGVAVATTQHGLAVLIFAAAIYWAWEASDY